MKRSICCILVLLELFLLAGCKSHDVRNVEKSIESNCEKICKDFYESGTEAYDVDCTFIMNDCYGGEIFTIVNGEPQ